MRAIADVMDLVLPVRCVGCGRAGAAMCPTCLLGLPSEPVAVALGELSVRAAAAYAGAVRAALLRYKERGRRDLAAGLARLLERSVCGALDDDDRDDDGAGGRAPLRRLALVPVPSTRAAAAARGGDHVARLARRTAAGTGLRIADALILARPVRDSAGLNARERTTNLRGAMAARAAPPGWSALLVDDIVTTGATLREAHRALAAAGWPVVGAAVVAATPPPGAGRPSGTDQDRDTASCIGDPLAAPRRSV